MIDQRVGKQFWKRRETHGRPPAYTAAELLAGAEEYFQWVEANPLKEQKAFMFQGEIVISEVEKLRAMTLVGLCLRLEISNETFRKYGERDGDYPEVTQRIRDVIYEQKFTGAAADLLNSTLIARDLGLRDHKTVENDGVIKVVMSEKDAAL